MCKAMEIRTRMCTGKKQAQIWCVCVGSGGGGQVREGQVKMLRLKGEKVEEAKL